MNESITDATQNDHSWPPLHRQQQRLPAEGGIWVFILLDMLIFAEMFGIFGWYRTQNRTVFMTSQEAVNPWIGLLYTLLLLTSSWCVVMAVSAARRGLVPTSSKLVGWAFGFGAAFAVVKLAEYTTKVISGITPVTNDFFMFYFVMTIVHLLHASVGLGVLAYMRSKIRSCAQPRGEREHSEMRVIESGAVYWHMVDLLWIFLFALFYLRG